MKTVAVSRSIQHTMHQLFRLVLGQKDLSKAGDLFSLDDAEIEDSLTEALEQIKVISSSLVSKLVCRIDSQVVSLRAKDHMPPRES